MKAKSAAVKVNSGASGSVAKDAADGNGERMPGAESKGQILGTAADFFANNGLTGQTRRLAEECGISQRLLYRFFPTKDDLLDEVYRQEILGAFKVAWFAELQDPSRPVEQRLRDFYSDYLKVTLTRKWLRLFMYASLADARMAPDYISSIITQMLEVIMREAAIEKGIELPADVAAIHEMAWTLHGAISHYAIRRHLYHASHILPEHKVVAMHVRMFMAGFESMVQDYIEHLD